GPIVFNGGEAVRCDALCLGQVLWDRAPLSAGACSRELQRRQQTRRRHEVQPVGPRVGRRTDAHIFTSRRRIDMGAIVTLMALPPTSSGGTSPIALRLAPPYS